MGPQQRDKSEEEDETNSMIGGDTSGRPLVGPPYQKGVGRPPLVATLQYLSSPSLILSIQACLITAIQVKSVEVVTIQRRRADVTRIDDVAME